MSQPDEEQPVVRPRRRIQPPAYLTDYELGEPIVHRQPLSAFSQSHVQSPSSAGPTRSTSPVSQESEQEKWMLRDKWTSYGRGKEEEELKYMLHTVQQENTDLRRQTSQLPEIISTLKEMRWQNAMLHHELQSLKAERGAPSKPATSPVPSSDPFIPGVSQTVSQPYRPKPAPRIRVPPPASTREQQHEDATEHFKYLILTDHLKLEEALLVSDSYSNSRLPFTYTMRTLTKMYGQPHQLALQRIADLMDGPNIHSGDVKAFCLFGLHVRSLVSMLEQLGQKGTTELECGSHVSRLMSKLPHDLRSSFKKYTHPLGITIPTLLDFAEWLEYELQVQGDHTDYTPQSKQVSLVQRKEIRRDSKQTRRPTAILLGTEKSKATSVLTADQQQPVAAKGAKMNPYCPYCDSNRHFLNNCENFKLLTKEQKVTWIKSQNRCWRCGRGHQAAHCTLKALC